MKQTHGKALVFLTATWGVFFALLWKYMLAIDSKGLIVRQEYVWSDWALHLGLGSIFQLRSIPSWFDSHPIYAGSSLSYPFLTNLISGLLARAGASLEIAYLLPSFIFSIVLVLGIYGLGYQLTKSSKAAVVAVFLFLLGSGLGFDQAITALFQGADWESVLVPTVFYSRVEIYQWYSGNALVGMLIPQRAFLLGMAGVLLILNCLLFLLRPKAKELTELFGKAKGKRIGVLLVLGGLSGLIVVTHVHSFIALVAACSGLLLISRHRWREWAIYAAAAGLVSLILYKVFISSSIETDSFMQSSPLWTYGDPLTWLAQWWRNWGFLWPVAIMGGIIAFKEKRHYLLGLTGGLFCLFVLANLILFQPVAWDNSKLFLWAYLGLVLLTILALQKLWRRKLKILVVVLLVLLSATGTLDLAKLLSTEANNNFYLVDRAGMELADYVAHNTPETAVVLTAPTHNHPVTVLGARTIFMGYPGWLYNYGFNYQPREEVVKQLFENPKASRNLFEQYQLSYLIIGPDELRRYQVDIQYFQENWQLLYSNEEYQLWYRSDLN